MVTLYTSIAQRSGRLARGEDGSDEAVHDAGHHGRIGVVDVKDILTDERLTMLQMSFIKI